MVHADNSGTRKAHYDAVVVGAGFGGLYGVHRLRKQGLDVLGIECAADVGGVWYHNRYPGARVDVESYDYCFYFSQELYEEWQWTEKFATQPEILSYMQHVADRFDLRRSFEFNTWVTGAQWHPEEARYHVTTSTGLEVSCRFLIMATGQLSAARPLEFEGLDQFQGEWVSTSSWPADGGEYKGKRVGVIGTGSSGVQVIPVVAEEAAHLHVFQRTPKYSVPARNGPMETSLWQDIKADVDNEKAQLLVSPAAVHMPMAAGPASDFSEQEQQRILDEFWARGGQSFQAVFADQGTNIESNNIVADFVLNKIREKVDDPALAEKLCPDDHPFGSRRLIVDTDYYETFNRDNVSLVDVRAHPIKRITETGIETNDGQHYELDLIIFALGFNAFTGSLDRANIRNGDGLSITEHWQRGPRTMLGITTSQFPNLFLPTGPGSPSLIANLVVQNEYQIDWAADCIAYMDKHGYTSVEPTEEAENKWTEHVADVAKNLLRLHVDNYMVHVNQDDGSRVYLPYAGGMSQYVQQANEAVLNGYKSYRFTSVTNDA